MCLPQGCRCPVFKPGQEEDSRCFCFLLPQCCHSSPKSKLLIFLNICCYFWMFISTLKTQICTCTNTFKIKTKYTQTICIQNVYKYTLRGSGREGETIERVKIAARANSPGLSFQLPTCGKFLPNI